jgi:predicted esterase
MDRINEYHFITKRTARFYVASQVESPKILLIALHGYMQLAKDFVRHLFDSLTEDQQKEVMILAPEALSRSYVSGSYGKVGASWMTKEDRINEIKDYIAYLNELVKAHLRKVSPEKIIVLGFSQGGATACRWLCEAGIKVDNLVLWGSYFPDDLIFENLTLNAGKIWIVRGDKDPYHNQNQDQKMKEVIEALKLNSHFYIFDGGHSIPGKVFREFMDIIIAGE